MDGGANALASGEHDLLSFLRPDTLIGALAYLALFLFIGLILSRLLRATVHAAMTREGRIDRGGIGFVQQLGTALIWVMIVILYAHLIPVLRALGTAMLAGAGVASVVIGLAAQSTLGNLVAGISITIYRPFRLGDTLQVTTPTGTEIGVVEWISLGYTTLRTGKPFNPLLGETFECDRTEDLGWRSFAEQVLLRVDDLYLCWFLYS